MRVLAIESAALVASVALVDEKSTLVEYTLNTKLTHSQTLLPLIDEMFRQTGLAGADLDAIAVSAGPGSFTGLRIGAATAKALGTAWQKPLVAVPTLDALAQGLWGCRYLICPIMDARRDQVYTALYRFTEAGRPEGIREAQAVGIEDLTDSLMQEGLPVLFTGDGVPVFQDVIREKMQDLARFAPPHMSRQRAAAVGSLGLEMLQEGITVEAERFAPFYLRVSQAERERAEREGRKDE